MRRGLAAAVAVAALVAAGPAYAQDEEPPIPVAPAQTPVAEPTAIAEEPAPAPAAAAPAAAPEPSPQPQPAATAAASPPEPIAVAAQAPPEPPVATPEATATPEPTVVPEPVAPPSAPVEARDADPCAITTEEGGCTLRASRCTIVGTPGDDTITGTPLRDLICGLGGADWLDGRGGDDLLAGGDGDDVLIGGPGWDCLIGGPGDDEAPDAGTFEPVDTEDEPGRVNVAPDGTCTVGGSYAFEGGAVAPRAKTIGGRGPTSAPVRAGAFFIAISRLLAASHEDGGAFPVTLARRAMVADGVVHLLLLCPSGARGELVFTARRDGRGRRIARTPFTCTAPSTVLEFELKPAVRDRLERAGRLRTLVNVATGGRTGRARVLLEDSGT